MKTKYYNFKVFDLNSHTSTNFPILSEYLRVFYPILNNAYLIALNFLAKPLYALGISIFCNFINYLDFIYIYLNFYKYINFHLLIYI